MIRQDLQLLQARARLAGRRRAALLFGGAIDARVLDSTTLPWYELSRRQLTRLGITTPWRYARLIARCEALGEQQLGDRRVRA